MGNIIDFNLDRGHGGDINFDYYMKQDPYLRLTFINALRELGYNANTEDIKCFQEDNEIEVTGEVGLKELLIAINVFDVEQAQKIIDYVNKFVRGFDEVKCVEPTNEEITTAKKEKKKTTRTQISAIIWMLTFFAFFFYGLITAFSKLYVYLILK